MPVDVQYRVSRGVVYASEVCVALSPVAKASDATEFSQQADEFRGLGQERPANQRSQQLTQQAVSIKMALDVLLSDRFRASIWQVRRANLGRKGKFAAVECSHSAGGAGVTSVSILRVLSTLWPASSFRVDRSLAATSAGRQL